MPTNFVRRFLCICPEGTVAAFNTWVTNNLQDAGVGNWLTTTLNSDGLSGSATSHRWFCAALQEADLKRLLIRLCVLAGITQPSNWDTLTALQKAQWMASNLDTIYTNTGIRVHVSDNDGVWDDFVAKLALLGLKVKGSAG